MTTMNLATDHMPSTRGHKSFPPPPWPGAARKARRILRPYGRNSLPAFTLDTFTTPDPECTGWRLFAHLEDDSRVILFEASDLPAMSDPDDEVRAALDWACIQPGDEGDTRLSAFTPAQLDWSMRHAAALRKEARERLGWGSESLRPLRADLDVVYQVRRDLASANRHRARAGVVEVVARTRVECKETLVQAVANHVSALPTLRWGARSGAAYLLYPHGRDWCVQRAAPGEDLEAPMVLRGASESQAREALDRVLRDVERAPRIKMTTAALPAVWRPRPSARAGREAHG